jgi:hypothetical protein
MTQPYFTATSTHHCDAEYMYAPVGFRDQLEILLEECYDDFGLPKSRKAACDAALALASFFEDEDHYPIETTRLEDHLVIDQLFNAPFAKIEALWAQAEYKAQHLFDPGDHWAGIKAPAECYSQSRFGLKSFAPFSSCLWIAYPTRRAVIAQDSPKAMIESPSTIEAGQHALALIIKSFPAAEAWVNQAISCYVDHAFPLLAARRAFTKEALMKAKDLALGPLFHTSLVDYERSTLDQREAFALYIPGKNDKPGGFQTHNGELGGLNYAQLFASSNEAGVYARGRPHAVARVSIRIEDISSISPGCDAEALRSICADREKSIYAQAIDTPAQRPDIAPISAPTHRARAMRI